MKVTERLAVPRRLLGAFAMAAFGGVGSLSARRADAQIMGAPGPLVLWLDGVRHISVSARVQVQDAGDRGWHGLRPEIVSGDPPQARADGLIRNDLAGDFSRPSVIDQRARALGQTLLSVPRSPSSIRSAPRPVPLPFDVLLPRAERDNALRIEIQFYIRDISQDLIVPPPARVATVLLTEVILYRRHSQTPPLWPSGPSVSVETVVRSGATAWMFEKLDAAVTRVLEPWTTNW
ncbi:hypothetical protein [Roseomonas sp. CECT 9278]|uniref:hypothetical protein n=1 Tax=Roseomonas sp. CECT 9278 TaxID=2845823 RepID=UPI001E37126A|nr:hypothetical protein [Roseomonas sp. CECT 9278]